MAEDVPETAALFVTGILFLLTCSMPQKIGRRQAHCAPAGGPVRTKAQ